MNTEPTKEHAWLKRYLGEWTYESECPAGPGGEMMKTTGQETVRAIGDLWIQGEGRGQVPGVDDATMILTVGFDPERGRFVGTWVGSMMSNLWVYEGWLEGDDTLVLESTGPVWQQPGKTAKYRDITEFKGPDERAFRAMMLKEDGSWQELMSARYRRAK